jgi:hypothetical protein
MILGKEPALQSHLASARNHRGDDTVTIAIDRRKDVPLASEARNWL